MAPTKLPPPSQWHVVECDLSFVNVTKHAPDLHIRMHFRELQAKYCCPEFYTDASKSHAGVSYAAVGPSYTDSDVLHPETSIFTAEAYAVFTAVKHIRQLGLPKAVVFTDSLSVVKALSSLQKHKNPVINNLYSLLCSTYASSQHVIICWVPGHRGIEGNVLADKMATSIGTRSNSSCIPLPSTDLKLFLRKKLRMYWQGMWNTQTSNKLHLIKPHLGNWPSLTKVRQTEVMLCRLRVGHTFSTHSYLLTGAEPPTCCRCGETLTVLHVLIQCRQLEHERKKHFPQAYREHIPLHPAMFLGTDSFYHYRSVLAFLENSKLQVIRTRDP